MSVMEKLVPGVNGAIIPDERAGRYGFYFRSQDGSFQGPFRPAFSKEGEIGAFMLAKEDWWAYLDKQAKAAK